MKKSKFCTFICEVAENRYKENTKKFNRKARKNSMGKKKEKKKERKKEGEKWEWKKLVLRNRERICYTN